jgi:hypothetical protein
MLFLLSPANSHELMLPADSMVVCMLLWIPISHNLLPADAWWVCMLFLLIQPIATNLSEGRTKAQRHRTTSLSR